MLKSADAPRDLRWMLQLFIVKPDSLQPTTYYIGIFNMDYYIHQPYSYTLLVNHPRPCHRSLV